MNTEKKITVIGLGYGAPNALTLGAWEALSTAKKLLFRTKHHPTVTWLAEKGITGATFDETYETGDDFDQVYREITSRLVQMALNGDGLAYAVPGDPWVAEKTVRLLLEAEEREGITVEVISSPGAIEAVCSVLRLDPTDGLSILDALELPETFPGQAMIITQVYSALIASEVKLWLLNHMDAEEEVILVKAAGIAESQRVEKIPLYELDRQDWVDHLTSLYVPQPAQTDSSGRYPADPLVEVMQRLRGEDGCPWDRQQTHQSLKPFMLEESYEVWEAIDEGNPEKLCDELGDLLLQVVFHAQIAAEKQDFDLNDVVQAITEKLIRRHPHVFGEVEVSGAGEVLVNWEEIKKNERLTGPRGSALDGVPRHLAGLAKAQKIQSKAAKVGFAWLDVNGVMKKLDEELSELRDALRGPQSPERQTRVEDELGDVLFALTNLARYTGIDSEVAIHSTIAKFQQRFRWIEEHLESEGAKMKDLPLEELLGWWYRSKAHGY